MPYSEFERLKTEVGGDLRKLEKSLSLKEYYFDGDDVGIAYFKREDLPTLRLPKGSENGANEEWIPGGKQEEGLVKL